MTMPRDHISATIQEALPIITELRSQEDAVAQAKRVRDKAGQRTAENLARQKRGALYDLRKPAAIHQYLEATKEPSAAEFKAVWQRNETQADCLGSLADEVQKLYEEHFRQPDMINLDRLSLCSFMLQFIFLLEQPLLTKDEQDFYIIDNPVRRDKVFRLPYVAPSSWKGCLRATLRQLNYNDDTESIRRLFGSKKGAEDPEEFRSGRLHFFPTFFTQKSLEIINPHNRVRKVGINPILIESVPPGTEGCFTLLYVPFDRVGEDRNEVRCEVAEDLRTLSKGLSAMFHVPSIRIRREDIQRIRDGKGEAERR